MVAFFLFKIQENNNNVNSFKENVLEKTYMIPILSKRNQRICNKF